MSSNEQKEGEEEEGEYPTTHFDYDSPSLLSSLLLSFDLNNDNNNNDNKNNNNNNNNNNYGLDNIIDNNINNEESDFNFNLDGLNENALDVLDSYIDYNHYNHYDNNNNNMNDNNEGGNDFASDLSNALDQLNSLSPSLPSTSSIDNTNDTSNDNNNNKNIDNKEEESQKDVNNNVNKDESKNKEEEKRRREEEEEYERMMIVIKQQKKKTYSTRAISKKFRISKPPLSPDSLLPFPPDIINNINDNNIDNNINNDNNNNNNNKSDKRKVPQIKMNKKGGEEGMKRRMEVVFEDSSLNSPKPLFDLSSDLPPTPSPHPLVHFSVPSLPHNNINNINDNINDNNNEGSSVISDHLSDLLSSLNINNDNNNNDNDNDNNNVIENNNDDFDLTAALNRLNQYNNNDDNNDNNMNNNINRDAIAELNDSLHSLSFSDNNNENDDDNNNNGEGLFDLGALENININFDLSNLASNSNDDLSSLSSLSSSLSSPLSSSLSSLFSLITNENLNTNLVNNHQNNNKKEEKEKVISYDDFFRGLKGGGGEESGSGEAAQQRFEEAARDRGDRLLRSFAVKEDMNKRGMKRTSKKSYTLDLHGRTIGVYQMEDCNYVGHPVFGSADFALFAVFDGHVGRSAAEFASLHLHSEVEEKIKKYGVSKEMGKVLKESFYSLDEKMKKFELEGTTATVVLMWKVGSDRFLQSANVGDSSSFLSREDKAIMMSKDHKINDPSERERLIASGTELFPNQNRINGLAVSRALGDHMIKSNFPGVTSEPHLSDVFQLRDTDDKLIIASDGLWDIVSGQTAVNMIKDMKEASSMASTLVSKAVSSPKCNDNVTVIVVLL